MQFKDGCLVISLDLEMRWGVLESYKTFDEYKENILGVENAVSAMLDLFNKYKIHATWATVGGLMCKDYEEFNKFSPKKKPNYKKNILSPYELDSLLYKKEEKQFFNPSIVQNILKVEGQEIASHTFSHLFLKEEGIVSEDFLSDNISFSDICEKYNIKNVNTIIFPRNQVFYIDELKKTNIKLYRGNQQEWYFNVGEKKLKRKFAKIFRFYDLHFSRKNRTVLPTKIDSVYNIPASVFLRPYDNDFLVSLRVKRIKNMMDRAKQDNRILHLWWHPHNFGVNLEKNLNMLEEIIKYSNKIGLNSKNMKECIL